MPLQGIEILRDEKSQVHANVRYVRLHVTDVSLTLREIFMSLLDASWVSKLQVKESIRDAYRLRVQQTTDALRDIFQRGNAPIDSQTGEYVVSESARRYLVDRLGYLDIPLGELLKEKIKGNAGFDFFSANQNDVLLFGEAKYRTDESGCSEAFNQIHDFIETGKDVSDIADIQNFMTDAADANFRQGLKGYIAAFTTAIEDDVRIVRRITHHPRYSELAGYSELICIAIQLQP